MSSLYTILDIVKKCDSFPYLEDGIEEYKQFLQPFYTFKINGFNDIFGYYREDQLKKVEDSTWEAHKFAVDHKKRTLTLMTARDASPEERGQVINAFLWAAREKGHYEVLKGKCWRKENYPICRMGTKENEMVAEIERSGSCLFGVPTYGVHMTGYVTTEGGSKDDWKIWIPHRAEDKSTFPGMLDNVSAGGLGSKLIKDTKKPQYISYCMIKEAGEEANIPEEAVAKLAVPIGCLTYIYVRDDMAQPGGEVGLLQPECEFNYDMEIKAEEKPEVNDGEVADFTLMTIEEVMTNLKANKFKANSATVMIDFLMRHGFITPDNEPDYMEISARMHRRLRYPDVSRY
ncbi:hypothetical protein FQN50_008729 [Emmonsiellopsis sp. PD_5]|nr:hypothetical protein FQN50_008729 [Emmonsiellopsis sp. PD_5]